MLFFTIFPIFLFCLVFYLKKFSKIAISYPLLLFLLGIAGKYLFPYCVSEEARAFFFGGVLTIYLLFASMRLCAKVLAHYQFGQIVLLMSKFLLLLMMLILSTKMLLADLPFFEIFTLALILVPKDMFPLSPLCGHLPIRLRNWFSLETNGYALLAFFGILLMFGIGKADQTGIFFLEISASALLGALLGAALGFLLKWKKGRWAKESLFIAVALPLALLSRETFWQSFVFAVSLGFVLGNCFRVHAKSLFAFSEQGAHYFFALAYFYAGYMFIDFFSAEAAFFAVVLFLVLEPLSAFLVTIPTEFSIKAKTLLSFLAPKAIFLLCFAEVFHFCDCIRPFLYCIAGMSLLMHSALQLCLAAWNLKGSLRPQEKLPSIEIPLGHLR